MFDEQNILREDNPYIFILSRGDYEFIVAAFAILSIGGALVPLCELLIMTVLGVEEID
jgi:malonyl-CoA/methylmalonyl-CoA synthetase